MRIPDTDYNPSDADGSAYRQTRDDAADSARRVAAALSGAIEGFLEGLDRYDVQNEAKEAFSQASSVTRAAVEEGRAQGQTPEMRELGHDLKRLGTAATGATTGAAASMRDATTSRIDATKEAVAGVKHTMHEKVESAQFAAQRLKADAKVRAEALGESGRRARVAPGRVMTEVKGALGAWWGGLMKALGMFALVALLGITAFIVFTIALVALLSILVGLGWAALIVAIAYVALAGVAFLVARSARERASEEVAERMENSREEIRNVGAPLKRAFGRGRTGI